MKKTLLSILLILAIFAVPMIAQDEPKKDVPKKEEPKTDEKPDGIEPVEPADPKKAEEAEAWAKVLDIIKGLRDRTISAEDKEKLYEELTTVCENYVEKYWGVNNTNTVNIVRNLISMYRYIKKDNEKLMKLADKCLKSDLFDERFKLSIMCLKAENLMDAGKYKEALAEFDSLKLDINKLDWETFQKYNAVVIDMGKIYYKMKKMDEYNLVIKKIEEMFDKMEDPKLKNYKGYYLGKIQEVTVDAGCVAPNWKIVDLEGNEVELKSFKGKYVLLDFWATWCGPCRNAMENHLKPMFAKYKDIADKFVIISIGSASERETVEVEKAFIEKMGYKWTFLYDKEKTASKQYFVSGIPTLVFIDPDGKIVFRGHGDVAEKVQKFLDEKFDIKEEPKEESKDEEPKSKDF